MQLKGTLYVNTIVSMSKTHKVKVAHVAQTTMMPSAKLVRFFIEEKLFCLLKTS